MKIPSGISDKEEEQKMKFNLSWFDDPATYTTTIYKDSGISTATASPTSGTVAEGATVTLSITAASGYELDEIEVVSGGVEIEIGDSITFDMGEANVVLNVKSKKSTMYKVTENVYTCVNGGTPVLLTKNIVLGYGKNGDIVDLTCAGTDCTSLNASVLAQLVDAGILIKI